MRTGVDSVTCDRDRMICNLGCEEEVGETKRRGIALVALSDRYSRVWVYRKDMGGT